MQQQRQSPSFRERRESVRYPIQLQVEYRSIHRLQTLAGAGRTVNMSSIGILFASADHFSIGTRLEVRISWPVPLKEQYPLQLIARGLVTRAGDGQIAVHIVQYGFHLCSPDSVSPPESLPHQMLARLSKYHS